ncbi:aminotransferase class I and II domain-containing protein [Ditylenchus destructor]|uniref:Aminotransferase class I and II domain-containing protein n=1 Tax=Ditylenchus destructor TaxID=166010 RepID=A0AAD4MPK3_9BILA|nr:aminotransferase class I and II domain-containing protein [Ditylenchus destructor]
MVSDRAQQGLNIPSFSSKHNKLHHDDPHDPETNKEGYIMLGSADSVLCADLIGEKFESIDWTKFPKESLFVYPRGGGEVSTLNSMANFINKFCRKGLAPFPAEELVIVPGVTTGADLLGQILFDSGDVVLVPAPYYFRFANDFGERGLVRIGVVPALSICGQRTELHVERFEKAYQEGQKVGKVRAITLVNPQNPEGGYFSLEELRPIVEWALKKDLYIVLDEIYDLSIYDEDPNQKFQSATELFTTPEARQKLIWLWGLSKNFALPGLRTAVLYTPNPIVRTACIRFLMHHLPNTTTQFIAREFINDHAMPPAKPKHHLIRDWIKPFPEGIYICQGSIASKEVQGTLRRFATSAAAYFDALEHLDRWGSVIDSLEAEDAASIRISQELFNKQGVAHQLAYIQCNFSVLPKAITKLESQDWIENVFLPTNLKRLKKARDQVLVKLDEWGVPYIKPRAGFFVLMDFSKYLDEPTFEGERRLHEKIANQRVLISAGETMIAPKPGFFRMVFTSVDSATLDEALRRIGIVLKEQEKLNAHLAIENGISNGATNGHIKCPEDKLTNGVENCKITNGLQKHLEGDIGLDKLGNLVQFQSIAVKTVVE